MAAGQRFGKYILLERIAYGGMAEVYRAKAVGAAGFQRDVAIKKLHARYSSDPEVVAMLQDEARLVSLLHHPNICQVFDLGMVGDSYYIAMEFVHGQDLSQVLRKAAQHFPRTLPYPAVFFIMREVLAGLDYAHKKRDSRGRHLGIIHRDISPQNILVSYEGQVKIIDFGIAKAKVQSHKTEQGVIKGKFRYMSPEQARGEPVDHRSDIFAAGVVFYELILGRPHSKGLTDMQVLLRLQQGYLEPLDQLVPDVPEAVNAIIEKALAPDPRRRFSTAGEFKRQLDAYCRAEGLDFDRDAMAVLMQELFPDAYRAQTQMEPVEELDPSLLQEAEEAASGGTIQLTEADLMGPAEPVSGNARAVGGALEPMEVDVSLTGLGSDGTRAGTVRARPGPTVPEPAFPEPPLPELAGPTPAAGVDGAATSPVRRAGQRDAGGSVTARVRSWPSRLARGLKSLLVLAVGAVVVVGVAYLVRGWFGAKKGGGGSATELQEVRAKWVRAELAVSSRPEGVHIFVDGKDTGYVTPAKFAIEAPGRATVSLRKGGKVVWEEEVLLGDGETVTVEADLNAQARRRHRTWRRHGRRGRRRRAVARVRPLRGARTAQPAEPGELIVQSSERAWVYVDGQRMDVTGRVIFLKPGRHHVYVRKGDRKSVGKTVEIQSGTKTVTFVELP